MAMRMVSLLKSRVLHECYGCFQLILQLSMSGGTRQWTKHSVIMLFLVGLFLYELVVRYGSYSNANVLNGIKCSAQVNYSTVLPFGMSS